jgi:ABC-type sugar transport system permease subunit
MTSEAQPDRGRLGLRLSIPWSSARGDSFRRHEAAGLALTLPILALFVVFNLLPTIYAFGISLTQFDLFSAPKFVGLDNYAKLVNNANFWRALTVTAGYTLLFGPASWVIGFLIAYLLKGRVLGRDAWRSVFFIPTILSSVAMAVTWSLLLRLNGPLNAVLDINVPWLTNSQTALLGISILGIWQSVGWWMVIFLAGLLSIPENLIEAARIDGAGPFALLRHITLPLLRPVFAVVAVQTIVAGMKVFSPMFIMTGGGPNNSTRSIAMLIYQEGLRDLRFGNAAAISVIGFLIIMVLTVFYLRIFRVREEIGY